MRYTMRPLAWDQARTPPAARKSRWTFRAGWQDTLDLLDRELTHLAASNVIIEADFREGDLRQDGMPRAAAKEPTFPGVRISFDSRHGRLVYGTDAYELWQHNVRAIALSLEALRAVDRYGATRSAQQYAGWKAIDAGPTSASASQMTREEAARFIAAAVDPVGAGRPEVVAGILSGQTLKESYRLAARKLHPDAGGSPNGFQQLQQALHVLGSAAA